MSALSHSMSARLSVIDGDCHPVARHRSRHAQVADAIHAAKAAGFLIGRPVMYGKVIGLIIGYNIGDQGLYYASRYPLLVETAYGTIKSSLSEVCLA